MSDLNKSTKIRRRIATMLALVGGANVAVWIAALAVFHNYPLLIGTAILAFGFGLRHAVDADHIAAIDNVTRKLMQEGKTPVGVGLFFSLGHSTIVFGLSAAAAGTALMVKTHFESLENFGNFAGTLVSALFLLAIAIFNIFILSGIFRTFRQVKAGGRYQDEDLDLLLARRGFFARIFRRVFRMISRDWQMYPVGFLFGLGFDTATEVGLLGISAAEATKGLPVWSIMLFPALFAAGMAAIDTLDNVLMLGAYNWAFVKPIRKLYYNMTITSVSIIVALVIGGIETLGLAQGTFDLSGPFWDFVTALNEHFGMLGYLIIGIFVASWMVSMLVYRLRRYDEIEVTVIE